jgi:uncharacterized membrane protein
MSSSRTRIGLWVIAGLAIVGLTFAAATRSSQTQIISLVSTDGSDTLAIPISSIAPGQVRFFVYRGRSGSKVRLIIARDDRGNLGATLDACERCYMYHRGYEAAHGVITCRWCGTHYKVASMTQGLSGCVPIKVPFRTYGQSIRIQTAELERQSKLF